MKAMILAAGKGTRVRPLTTMLPDSVINHLRGHAFDKIYINTSCLSRPTEDCCRDGGNLSDHISPGIEFDRDLQLLQRLIKGGEKVCAINLPFEWVDIGCISDSWKATRLIDDARKPEANDPAHDDLRASMRPPGDFNAGTGRELVANGAHRALKNSIALASLLNTRERQ